MRDFHSLRSSGTRFLALWQTRLGKRIVRGVRTAFVLAVVAYLAWELTSIGWEEIRRSLPTQPLFYILFGALYVLLPLSEVLIYRLCWVFGVARSVPAFLIKRAYNREVLGYSGEVYFFSWVRKHVDSSDRALLETIRDNNVISSAASTLITVVLLCFFLLAGKIRMGTLLGEHWAWYLTLGALALAVMVPVLVRYRRFLFTMPVRLALSIFGIQCARLIVGQVLQISQWAVVMPGVGLQTWLTFAAVSLLVSRIPFLPNQSLVFMGVGVSVSGALEIPTAALASMLLVANVLEKILNLGTFGLAALARSTGDEPAMDPGRETDRRDDRMTTT